MAKGHSLQEPFLNALRKERIPVSVYLVNGIKLQGQIESFDQFVVLLKNSVSQMIYKHAISTVVPVRNVRLNLALNNLTNQKYWRWADVYGQAANSPTIDAYTQPGRNIKIALTADF